MAKWIVASFEALWNIREISKTSRKYLQKISQCSQGGRRANRVV